MNNLQVITQDIYDSRDTFAAVLSDKSISFEREAGFAVQVLQANDFSLKAAMADRQAVVNAVTNIAAIGISLNPAKKQAYLVPRKNKICLDISYMGLMDLAMSTGSVKWAQAALVHENDNFALNGYDAPPTHVFNPFSKDRGAIVGVYVVVKTATGDYLTHTMSIADAYAIRDRSEAWKSSKGPSGPWKTDEGEMIKKTCVKQAYKYWPKTERLEQAIHHLNTDGGEGIDFSDKPRADPDLLPKLMKLVQAASDPEGLGKVWKNGLTEVKATNDMQIYNAFKDAVSQRGATLRGEAAKIETPPDDGNTIEEQRDPSDEGFGQATGGQS